MNTQTQFQRDIEGYLVAPEEWSEGVALQLAAEENLTLTEKYWSILCFMREYWQEHQVAPDVRHVIQHLTGIHGYDKKTAKHQIFNLFPYGYVKQACKIAGMQRPRGWSTG
jgi:tRNA 2-thiouridine synthesizing protein E